MTHLLLRPTVFMRSRPKKQRGVVLLFTMIALLVMLIGCVALMRSFNASMFTAGNISFKRDMQSQSDRAVDAALNMFRSGGVLNLAATRAASVSSSNYSAVMLAVNEQGIPKVLGTDAFDDPDTGATVGVVANDISPIGQAVTIRYVIDRQCSAAGNELALGAASCQLAGNPVPAGTSTSNLQGADRASLCATCVSAVPQGVIYRLSIKVTGPRGTQSFFQSTFTVPSSS
jgi:type IV pilus assembly protein PilX